MKNQNSLGDDCGDAAVNKFAQQIAGYPWNQTND